MRLVEAVAASLLITGFLQPAFAQNKDRNSRLEDLSRKRHETITSQPQARPPANPAQSPPGSANPAPPLPVIMFANWRDPREGAFSLNVPRGWQISGGTSRAAPIDARHIVNAATADGRIKVFIDDPDIKPRQIPDAMMQAHGLREGQILNSGAGPVLLARFRTGVQFAQEYIAWKLCRQPQITQSAALPNESKQMNAQIGPIGRAAGVAVQAHVGEASFRCGQATGYVLATTVHVQQAAGYGVQTWNVIKLGGFLVSNPAEADYAKYILHTMLSSFTMNPQWEAQYTQQIRDVMGAITRMQQAMAANIAQHSSSQASLERPRIVNPGVPTDLRKKWASEDKTSIARSQATLGTKETSDPVWGNRTVGNEYNYYWTRPDGSIMGTNTTTPPDYSSGWRMMKTQ